MINPPKVSIITIYYNRQNYIDDSIRSLINQTYKNIEIIIVDDCSSDNTYNYLKKLNDEDNRITLLKNKINKGFTKSLIDSISFVNSKYVAIHGAGDISMPTRIEEQVIYLENNPDVGVLSSDIVGPKNSKFQKQEITLNDLLIKNRIIHGSVIFSLEDYFKAGGYRNFFTTRQDKDLWFRMSLITKIHFLNKKLYKLITIKSSVSQKSSFNPIPTLLSNYAKFLILERIVNGEDSLDKYGVHSGLIYRPSNSNFLVYKLIWSNIKTLNFQNCLNYTKFLISFNGKMYYLFFKFQYIIFKILKKFI